MRYSEAGKGSRRRPQQVPDDEMCERWLRAFGAGEITPEQFLAWCDGCGEVYTEQEDSDGGTACDCCAPGRSE
jgi:hypothetical protein